MTPPVRTAFKLIQNSSTFGLAIDVGESVTLRIIWHRILRADLANRVCRNPILGPGVFDRRRQKLARVSSCSNCSKNGFSSSSARLLSEITLFTDIGASFLLAFSGEAAGFLLITESDAPFLISSSTTFGYTSSV
jgi:hypothetical protein